MKVILITRAESEKARPDTSAEARSLTVQGRAQVTSGGSPLPQTDRDRPFVGGARNGAISELFCQSIQRNRSTPNPIVIDERLNED